MMIPEDAQNEALEQRDSAVDLEAFVEQDTREVRTNGSFRQSTHA